jgi:hypothetical protein
VVVPDQAVIVREIFSRYAAGESCQRLAADVNARGVRGPRGGTWSVSAVYGSPAKGAGILNNRLYIGRVRLEQKPMDQKSRHGKARTHRSAAT